VLEGRLGYSPEYHLEEAVSAFMAIVNIDYAVHYLIILCVFVFFCYYVVVIAPVDLRQLRILSLFGMVISLLFSSCDTF